jgi:hypothetical protein
MDNGKIVDLTRRRADERRQRRKAALSRFWPTPSMLAWAVLLAIAVLGYVWTGASSRFEKAPPAAAVAQ